MKNLRLFHSSLDRQACFWWLLVGVWPVGFLMLAITHGRDTPAIVFVCALYAALAVGFFLLKALSAALHYRVEIPLVTGPLQRGESVHWGAQITPAHPLSLGPARITLRCTASSRKSNDVWTYRHLVDSTVEAHPGGRFGAGEAVNAVSALTLPLDGEPSCSLTEYRVAWTLRFDMPVGGLCPDLREEMTIEVV